MSGNPDGCFLKLKWAEHYRQVLNEYIRVFYKDHPYEIVRESKAQDRRHIFRVSSLQPVPSEWSLLIGDVLYNARAVLDYLVYQLALNAHDPLSEASEKRCMFPITYNPAALDRSRWRIDMLAPDARTFIESLQPHFPGSGKYDIPLATLDALHSIDKHRRLNVVWHNLTTAAYTDNPNIRWEFSWKPLTDGAELAKAYCTEPDANVTVHNSTTIGVRLYEPGIRIVGDARNVVETIVTAVKGILDDAIDLFFT